MWVQYKVTMHRNRGQVILVEMSAWCSSAHPENLRTRLCNRIKSWFTNVVLDFGGAPRNKPKQNLDSSNLGLKPPSFENKSKSST